MTEQQSRLDDPAPVDDLRLSRRQLLPLVGAATLASLAIASPAAAQTDQEDGDDEGGSPAPSRFVYVGTYTAPNTAPGGVVPSTAKGIYAFKMDGATGGLNLIQIEEHIENPSWVAVDGSANHLYATSEVSTWKGTPNSGGLTAHSIGADGKITVINDQPTMGAIPAHVIVDPSGKFATVANYIGANFSTFPIRSDGGVSPASDVFAVTGKGPNTGRQEAPHPHEMMFDPAGNFVFGPDLGTDRVWSWTLSGAGKLVPNTNLAADQVASGSGPRHMSFDPSGKWVYVLGEMVSSITAFKYNTPPGAPGTFIWIQTVSTLPADFHGTSSTAEIIVHQSGKWVYASNRGHNSIVRFVIDQTTGMLSRPAWVSTEGAIPRGFNIDPSGRLMLVGNQNSDTVVPFHIGQSSGRLQPTGAVTHTPVPVSFAFGKVIP